MAGTIFLITVGCLGLRFHVFPGFAAIAFIGAGWLGKSPARIAAQRRAGQRPVTRNDFLILGAVVAVIVGLFVFVDGREAKGFVLFILHPVVLAVLWLAMCTACAWRWIKDGSSPADAGMSGATDKEGAE